MAPVMIISYAQRYEDMHLLRAFGDQASGFYIDIGAGHPVYDNVSFAFYLRGWSGITVEPNPWLAQLSEAVRPLDVRIQSLVGEKPWRGDLLSGRGFSWPIDHGRKPRPRRAERIRQALAGDDHAGHDLAERCASNMPRTAIDFLKIDVEGAEREVLLGGDWRRFRPKVVVLEALAPVTMAPAWEAWEPLLTGNGYRFAFFDSLNRYYVAEEHAVLAERLAAAPALVRRRHPIPPVQARARGRFASRPWPRPAARPDADMVRLPLMSFDSMAERLINGLDPAYPDRSAQPSDIAAAHQRLFGRPATAGLGGKLRIAPDATIRDLYRSAVESAAFRTACGRISASSAW